MACARHADGHLVTGGEHQMARTNRRPCRRPGDHFVRRRHDGGDVGRGHDACAARHGGAQEVRRQATGIGSQLVVAENRRPTPDANTALDLLRLQQRDLEARASARLGFPGEAARTENGAVEIQGVVLLEAGVDPQVPGALMQRIHGQPGSLPDTACARRADSLGQSHQRQIQIVLNQGGRCRGGARDRAATVRHHHAQAGVAEAVGGQCSADAGTDDQHIRRQIGPQRLVPDRQERRAVPDGQAGAQAAARGDAHQPDGIRRRCAPGRRRKRTRRRRGWAGSVARRPR